MEVDRTQSAKSRKNNERESSDCRVAQIHNKPRRSARVLLFVYRASDARLAKMLPVSDGFCYQWLQCARQTAEIIVMLKVILILHNNECDPELWDEVKRTKIIKKKKRFPVNKAKGEKWTQNLWFSKGNFKRSQRLRHARISHKEWRFESDVNYVAQDSTLYHLFDLRVQVISLSVNILIVFWPKEAEHKSGLDNENFSDLWKSFDFKSRF